MADKQVFFDYINNGYSTKGDFINLGAAMLNGETIKDALVKIPLKTLNRHGLIAGATGTGKTNRRPVVPVPLFYAGLPQLRKMKSGRMNLQTHLFLRRWQIAIFF